MSGYKGETDGLKCKKEGNKGRLKSHNLGHCARLAEPYTSETTDLPPPAQIYDLLRSIRLFLVADTQLYKRLCPSVGRLVGRSVGWSVTLELKSEKTSLLIRSQQDYKFHPLTCDSGSCIC